MAKKIDRLEKVMEKVTPGDIDATRKDARLNVRVTEGEKAEMMTAAKSLKVSLSEYLAALHHFAWPRLRK